MSLSKRKLEEEEAKALKTPTPATFDEDDRPRCPRCGAPLDYTQASCSDCGQALDWCEEEQR